MPHPLPTVPGGTRRAFHHLLINTLVASVVNFTVWFAVTFWVYLETRSVFATGVISGIYLVFTAASGVWFGGLVDRHRKRSVMLGSSAASLLCYVAALTVYLLTEPASFTDPASPALWALVLMLMAGVIVGNLRAITLSTAVTITIAVVAAIPGLFGLIAFSTINNFLGGVFMALLDAYGLSLVSVEVWGLLFGVLSAGFIVGGLIVARRGLGANPLRTLLVVNVVMWAVSSVFTLRSWILLLAVGMFVWLCLVPFAEAAEQTVLQKVVPFERQGRVFGFAQSVEMANAPPAIQWSPRRSRRSSSARSRSSSPSRS